MSCLPCNRPLPGIPWDSMPPSQWYQIHSEDPPHDRTPTLEDIDFATRLAEAKMTCGKELYMVANSFLGGWRHR